MEICMLFFTSNCKQSSPSSPCQIDGLFQVDAFIYGTFVAKFYFDLPQRWPLIVAKSLRITQQNSNRHLGKTSSNFLVSNLAKCSSICSPFVLSVQHKESRNKDFFFILLGAKKTRNSAETWPHLSSNLSIIVTVD